MQGRQAPDQGVHMLSPNARKWVEALRSGRFKQTRGVLTNDEGYCCLGVACQLFIEEGGDLKAIKRPTAWSHAITYVEPETDDFEFVSMLPSSVQSWLGLRGSMGEFRS